MKRTKHLIVTLVLMLLLAAVAVVSVSALDATGSCGEHVTWTFDEDTGTLTISGTGEMKDYSMDDQSPFQNCLEIHTVHINDGVTSVGDLAFASCTWLRDVTIPDSVTRIGMGAFHSCVSLTNVTIPSGVKSIGDSAFFHCVSLSSILIPDGVTSISDSTFEGCNGLMSVVIPDNVTSIGEKAFEYCSALTSITIPNSVTSIGVCAFAGCFSLTDYIFSGNNEYYSADAYGCLYNKDKTVLVQYPTGKPNDSFTIPEGVETIGDYAFYNCNSLTSIEIPNSVTSIGNSAFEYCIHLASITIPDSVITIGKAAFFWCSSLTNIEIPNSVRTIGDQAFVTCTNLTSMTIPESVTSIGREVFANCSSLIEFMVCAENENYSVDEFGCLYNKDKTSLVCYPAGNSRESFAISDSVTSINDFAFSHCRNLASIEMPDSVQSIGDGAFSACSSLTSIEIPASVQAVGEEAFSNCLNLTNIEIPDGVQTIGEFTFLNCTGLTSIEIPDSVTSIGRNAFCSCSGLTSIEIPNSVTSIGGWAFSECSSLTSIVIPDSVTSIENGAFDGCPDDLVIYGHVGSYAQQFAKDNDYTFVELKSTVETNPETGIAITYNTASYNGEISLSVTTMQNGGNYLAKTYAKYAAWDIKTLMNGVETQPADAVTVSIPVPAGYDESTLAVYHVNNEDAAEKVEPITVKDGMISFAATSFSIYIVVDESSEVEPHTHTYTSTVTTEPTCTTDGETTYTCTICGDTYTEPIPATGEHVDADNNGYCDACEEMMQGGQHCKYCGKIHDGLFGWLIKIFHSIFAIFKR